MSRYRVPFGGEHRPDETSPQYHPGVALALAASNLQGTAEQAREGKVQTPWGDLEAERRDRGLLLVATPRRSVSSQPVMLQAACRTLGLDPAPIEATGAQMRVVDVGRSVLVIPFDEPEDLEAAPEKADITKVPGVEAEESVGYVHTQTTPYARIEAITWGGIEPLAGLAAASIHLVTSGLLRPTYPRTRVVATRLPNEEDEEAEVTVQASKVGGEPKIELVLVGGEVEEIESVGT